VGHGTMSLLNRLSAQPLFTRTVKQYFGGGLLEPVWSESGVLSTSRCFATAIGKRKKRGVSTDPTGQYKWKIRVLIHNSKVMGL
jgi:hypothetical protein